MYSKQIRIVCQSNIDDARELPCIVTGSHGTQTDPKVVHHVFTVKSRKGHDLPWNLATLLASKHSEIHNSGTIKFADEHPEFKEWLLKHEWFFCPVLKKWNHAGSFATANEAQ